MDVIIPATLVASTVTRSTAASYYNSSGYVAQSAANTLRMNYDPINLSAIPHALVERASTNLNMFENFIWNNLAGTGYLINSSCNFNSAVAPNGKWAADKIVENTDTSSIHNFFTGSGLGDTSGDYTYSIYLKSAGRSVVDIKDSFRNDSWRFDLSAGTVVGSYLNSQGSIQSVGKGWYRCSVFYKAVTSSSNISLILVSSGNTSYNGNGVSGIYVWGQQLETGELTTPIATPVTFTGRSSAAYYVASNGDLTSIISGSARANNYNPDNLSVAPRLLLELAATNSCLQSEDFTNAVWVKATATATTNTTTSPDGATTADTLTDVSAVVTGSIAQTVTIPNNSSGYVFSLFIKKTVGATTSPILELTYSGGTTVSTSIVIDTDGGQAGYGGIGSLTSYSAVQSYKDYWRCSVALLNNSSGNTTASLKIYPAASAPLVGGLDPTKTGSIIAWGAQFEGVQTLPTGPTFSTTSYIKTTTGSSTRAADIWTWGGSTLRAADVAPLGMLYTNIPENDFPAWNNATTYGVDVSGNNSVIYNHVKYASLQAGNVGHVPSSSPSFWSVLGETNAYAMIDTQVGTQTVAAVGTSIVADVEVGSVTSLNFINVVADSIVAEVFVGTESKYSQTIDMTGGSTGVPITDYSLTGLTAYDNAVLRVTVNAASPKAAALGNLVVGTKYYLGSTETSPTIGIVDYSVKTIDAFGNPTLTKRGYAKRMNTKSLVEDSQVDLVARILSNARATPCVWNANTNITNLNSNEKTSLIIYGYYKDWEIDCAYSTNSYLTCTVEGLI